jgi:hypothetical protein
MTTALGFLGLFLAFTAALSLLMFIAATAVVLVGEWLEEHAEAREANRRTAAVQRELFDRLDEDRAVAELDRIWELNQ